MTERIGTGGDRDGEEVFSESGPGASGDFPETSASGHSLTATDVLEFLFCPRFTYFEQYLKIPEHQEKRFKVMKGRSVHSDKFRMNPDYLRKRIGCVDRKRGVYLASAEWGIRGVVDVVLFLEDGSGAPLDYKYAEYKDRTYRNHRFQLAFYGRLIRERFGVPVNRGFLVYTRSRNKLVEVEISEEMYSELGRILGELLDVVRKGVYPKPTKHKARCPDCCYFNLCEKVI